MFLFRLISCCKKVGMQLVMEQGITRMEYLYMAGAVHMSAGTI